MHIYIDESGSINNHSNYERYFVIALIRIIDKKKVTKAYKRFVSSNAERLKELDKDKFDDDGNILREGGKSFISFFMNQHTDFTRNRTFTFAETHSITFSTK